MTERPFDEPLAILAEAFGTDPRYAERPLADRGAPVEPAVALDVPLIAATVPAPFDGRDIPAPTA